MRAIFCGNLEYDARVSEIERLFKRYGRVERVDMKSGFAFVYMEDERDAEDAVRRLDRVEFGRKGRRLRVEWTKEGRDSRRSGGGRKPAANEKPSKTLFVINFDPIYTKSKDLERHFDPYGKITNIRIRRNFAFIQFETQEEATRALEGTNMSKLMDRVITVEYAIRDDDRKDGYSPDRRGRASSPERGGYDRRRSPSPYRRERASPDYGYGRDRNSPDYGRGSVPRSRPEARESPRYGREREARESPHYSREREARDSPRYGREREARESPRYGREREARDSPRYGRERDESPANGRYHSRSPPPRSPPLRSPPRHRSRSPPLRSPPRHRSRS